MTEKILIIDHHDNPADDRVHRFMAERDIAVELCLPFKGQAIPELDSRYRGAVIFGGSQNVTEVDQYPFLRDELEWIDGILKNETPLLGICLGAQLIAHSLGAQVANHPDGRYEFGYYEINPTSRADHWIDNNIYVTQAHQQQFELPDQAILLATGDEFPNQAFRYGDRVFGLQFHPEAGPNVFQRWQDSDWAFYDKPGAQNRTQQDQLKALAEPAQGVWFEKFLNNVFDLSPG